MEAPEVAIGDIIKIGTHFGAPKAKVLQIYSDEQKEHGLCGDLEIVYNQNGLKTVKDDVTWDGERWQLRGDGIVHHDFNTFPELR